MLQTVAKAAQRVCELLQPPSNYVSESRGHDLDESPSPKKIGVEVWPRVILRIAALNRVLAWPVSHLEGLTGLKRTGITTE